MMNTNSSFERSNNELNLVLLLVSFRMHPSPLSFSQAEINIRVEFFSIISVFSI